MAEEITVGEKQNIELRAQFAQAGEQWLTNAIIHPEEEANTRELREEQIRQRHPDQDLRFDYEHVVYGVGGVCPGKVFAERVSGIAGGEGLAVYGKPKPQPTQKA